MIEPQAAALLDALHEPALLVAEDGTVLRTNRALQRIFGRDIAGQRLAGFIASDRAAFDLYLARCHGSGDALVGALELAIGDKVHKAHCTGSAVRRQEAPLVLLRLSLSREHRFAALTRTVAELKEELGKRRRSEAMLEETVRDRELLLRELEHRVKNNMQMLSALLSGAEREAGSAEAKAALKDASMRFSAVSAVQQLLYRSDNLETIESRRLVSALADAVSSLAATRVETEVLVDAIDLPIDAAVPIGLILNELLTNALKYGRPAADAQRVRVLFQRRDAKLVMMVEDNGPGFDLSETCKRASGIGLVRGLLRQLGGSIEVEREGGSRVIVRLPEPRGIAAGGRA